MLNALDDAAHQALDHSDHPLLIVAERPRTGKRGRPRVEIDPQILVTAAMLRGPTDLAPVFNCGPRTVCRRMIEYGIAEAQPPVFTPGRNADGGDIVIHTTSTRPVSTLSDGDLLEWVVACLQLFPNHRTRMIFGFLKSFGHHVPLPRISAALQHILGRTSVFSDRRIQRREYHVAGPNALWHHDGQHGA